MNENNKIYVKGPEIPINKSISIFCLGKLFIILSAMYELKAENDIKNIGPLDSSLTIIAASIITGAANIPISIAKSRSSSLLALRLKLLWYISKPVFSRNHFGLKWDMGSLFSYVS